VKALLALLHKEIFHILRDRRTFAVVILLPIVEVVLFGFSIRTDVKDVRIAIVDPAPDYATLEVRNLLSATGMFTTVALLASPAALDPLFESGAVQEALVFQPRFANQLASGQPAQIQVISDATEPNTGVARQAYASAVIHQFESQIQPPGSSGRGGVAIVPVSRMRFNPTGESSHLFVPGLMAMVLTLLSALMTALSLTKEKEVGTMEALLVSPLRPWQIIIGKVAPYTVIGFASVIAVLLEARFIFGVPVEGSVALLLGEGLLFILVSVSLGILISASTSSQRVAMLGVMMGTMLPTTLLSGFIFPLESMPRVLQWVANVSPAKWFLIVARGIMLAGVGLSVVWRETLVLGVMAVVLLALSARSFHVRLD
jgi:ABC-2 type transport system permease protein